MTGNVMGNIVGPLYFIYFQLAGVLAAGFALKKEKGFARLVVGSAFGSLCMQWLPVLAAFVSGFDITGHLVAAAALLPVFAYSFSKADRSDSRQLWNKINNWLKENRLFVILFSATFALWCRLLNSHIIPVGADGAVHTGQCTYGDMNMHLGFITSIANPGVFPPVYSIFPDTRLAYPFLNASISSSIYLFGASLHIAYILPMMAAFFQVCGGMYLLGQTVLKNRGKALVTWVMVFFNGGLGFIYFIGLGGETGLTLKDIFTGFYTTPTNLIDHNIRWANIIADILLPQRASLFGYAILLSAVWLLYRSVWQGEKRYFVYTAVFAGALPLIHTHSFLAMVLISAAWLLLWLCDGAKPVLPFKGKWLLAGFMALMCTIQFLNNRFGLPPQFFFFTGTGGLAVCVVYGLWLMAKYISGNGYKELLSGWAVYILIAALLALPQLVLWTFGQVAEGGFLRGHFNWGNLGDNYLWFYIKNIGAPLVLIVAAIWKGGRKTAQMALPAAVIWFVAELIMFTPNTYDNNKLLYVAYMLLCVAGTDFAVEWYKNHKKPLSVLVAGGFVVLCTVSAMLTLGREYVSDYVLYSADHMALAEYVENNTDKSDVFLTNTRHNNEIAALTGRSIVCGSDVFLYYHGIDTGERKADVAKMYQRPVENSHLYEKYSVDYVVISSWERNDYRPDEAVFGRMFEKVFEQGGVTLYRVKKPA